MSKKEKLTPVEENLAIHVAYRVGLKRVKDAVKPKIRPIEKQLKETKEYLEEQNELLAEGKISLEDWIKFRNQRLKKIEELKAKKSFTLKPYKPQLRDLNRLQRFFYDRAITLLSEKTHIEPITEPNKEHLNALNRARKRKRK
ncbi:MAG: hypothetical protein DRO09_04075 [Thermoprotei archaeon]|nr:MAG: hypothetical protein DRO09_04075 [Thermoprotei archaeon]